MHVEVDFTTPFYLDMYVFGTVLLAVSFLCLAFTTLCLFQVRSNPSIKISGKERFLQKVCICVIFGDCLDIIFHLFPPTDTGSLPCTIQSMGVVFSDLLTFFLAAYLAYVVYMFVTQQKDEVSFARDFWWHMILLACFPLICMILVPTLNYSGNIGYMCWVATENRTAYFKIFTVLIPLILILLLNTILYFKTGSYINENLRSPAGSMENAKKLFAEFKYIPMVLLICWGPVITLYCFITYYHSKNLEMTAIIIARIGPTLVGTFDSMVLLVLQKKLKEQLVRNINHMKSFFTWKTVKSDLKQNLLEFGPISAQGQV